MASAPPDPTPAEGPGRSRRETETAASATGSAPSAARDEPRLGAESVAVRLGRAGPRDPHGRFDVTGLLGVGASGRVYALYDRDLRRSTALKVLAERSISEVEDFLEEARVTASLQHPNVLPVYDVDVTADGEPCFSMGRVQGRTLAEAIDASADGARDAKIATPNAVVTIFIGVCQAVAYAHARGLIHQDLKPANILLGDFGEVLVLDWGSASRVDADASSRRLSGTPLYMSPEQARGEYADRRSDVYCLGAALFHALILRPPTWADDADAFLERKRRGAIDPLSAAEARVVPPALASIAMTALSADPAARYAGAADMAADLERFQAGLAVSVHREPLWTLLRRWYRANRRFFWGAAAASLAILALAAALARERALRSASWVQVAEDRVGAPLAELWRLRSRDWVEREMRDVPLDDASRLRREGGSLILSGDGPVDLSRREPVLGGLRVEWDYTPLSSAANLNCFIEGDSRDTGYAFHVGALDDPTLVVLSRGLDLPALERARLAAPLEVGRAYRFAMEKDGSSVRLTIDGRRLIDYEDLDPEAPAAGTFGFDACIGAVNRVDHLRIWHLPLARRITPVVYARNLLQLRSYDLAYAQFADIYASYGGTALAPEALYGMALSRARAGRGAEALALLQRFAADYPGHALTPYCLRERIAIARAAGDAAALEQAILALRPFRDHPLVRSVATQLATDEIAGIGAKAAVAVGEERYPDDVIERIEAAVARMRRWCGTLGIGLDQASFASRIASVLSTLGRDDLVLELFPDQAQLRIAALTRMGRLQEALAEAPAGNGRGEALIGMGRCEEVMAGPFPVDLRRRAAEILGGPARALELLPRDPTALIDAGRFDEAVAAAPDNALVRANALDAQHRPEEALRWARPPWLRCSLLLQLSRIAEAEPLMAADTTLRYGMVWRLIAGGREREGRELLARLVGLHHPPLGKPEVAFTHFFLAPLLDNRDGRQVDPATAWRDLLERRRYVDMQWPWHLAAVIAGRIDEQAFLAQPLRAGVERRLHLARGMKAELARDWRGAAEEYRACLALPFAGMPTGDAEYVRWRLDELERPLPADRGNR